MNTIVFDGVEYTKASVAAKILKYTPDYLGQLCRGKKIDARLVGRTWFVNLDSVRGHKQKLRQTKISPEPKSADLVNEIKLVRPAIKLVTQRRAYKEILPPEQQSMLNTRSVPVSYEIDEGYLMPEIKKVIEKAPRTIVVEQAGARPVKINSQDKALNFAAGSLPEVSLSGELKVTTYPEAVTQIENSQENKPISAGHEVDANTKPEQAEVVNKVGVKINHTPIKAKSSAVTTRTLPATAAAMTRKAVNANTQLPRSTGKEINFLSEVVPTDAVSRPSLALVLSPVIALVVALVCVGLIFSASSTTVISKTSYNSQVVLQLANLLEIFKHLK